MVAAVTELRMALLVREEARDTGDIAGVLHQRGRVSRPMGRELSATLGALRRRHLRGGARVPGHGGLFRGRFELSAECAALVWHGRPGRLVLPRCSGAAIDAPPPIRTSHGAVQGSWGMCVSDHLSSSVPLAAYWGIPFAAPPLGELRFAPPAPAQPWQGSVLNATVVPPLCMQTPPPPNGNFTGSISGYSEDCLYLNVFAPVDRQGLPVYIFFHGGGFSDGGSTLPTYDGACLASLGIVVVTTNYRLNVFGGFASEEFAGGPNGAFGFQDQQAAMNWVHEEIMAFGGDPARVTIGGQSAGALSVCMHGVTSASRPGTWFHGVISESGPCMSPTPLINQGLVITGMVPMEYALARGRAALNATGCADVACMRRLSPEHVLANASYLPGYSWNFAQDGFAMPADSLFDLWTRRQYDRSVRVMVGVCSSDYDLLMPSQPNMTWAQFASAVQDLVTEASLADGLVDYYIGLGRQTTAAQTFKTLFDELLVCSIEYQSYCTAWAGLETSYSYVFDHRPMWLPPEFASFGAYHTAELPFVFNNEWDLTFSSVPFTAEEVLLGKQVMSPLWASFVATGKPATSDVPLLWLPWPTSGEGSTAYLSPQPYVAPSVLDVGPCSIWNLKERFSC